MIERDLRLIAQQIWDGAVVGVAPPLRQEASASRLPSQDVSS